LIFSGFANCTFGGGRQKFFSNRAKFTIDVFGVHLAVVYNVTSCAVLTFDRCIQMNDGLICATWTNGAIEVVFGGFIFEITSTWAIVAFRHGFDSYMRGGRA
jgi:hypothetical protein